MIQNPIIFLILFLNRIWTELFLTNSTCVGLHILGFFSQAWYPLLYFPVSIVSMTSFFKQQGYMDVSVCKQEF